MLYIGGLNYRQRKWKSKQKQKQKQNKMQLKSNSNNRAVAADHKILLLMRNDLQTK